MDVLNELRALEKALASAPQSLEQMRQGNPLLWQELAWTPAQTRLWLRNLPDMQIQEQEQEPDNPSYCLGTKANAPVDLGDAIAKVVAELGRPVPIAQLRSKLPPGTVVTDPMLRAAIESHPVLMITGPMVRLANA
ncbi:hypothetical protein Thiowin_01486 [Thiorhodovibrio winogradskyi]|uniref:Uncharacterized protein n=1 Tax=Thiorhodovibrio winogradskyi TaxID=77007 RepID=A0ABZ0S8A9_9GAMM|nr:hypothetical protein [Thiorhodovibrio winogradskyi]